MSLRPGKRRSGARAAAGPQAGPGRAMVLGATGGIGRAFVEQLAAEGHELLVVARNRQRLEELARQVHATYGVVVEALAADLALDVDLRHVEDRVRGDARLEVLVNAAGLASWGRFRELDMERELDIIRVNVIAAVRLTKAGLSTMLPRRQGAIINVASLAGYVMLPFCATYGGTKAFLISFTEALHEELRGTGVRIQVVCPGFTRTDLFTRSGASTAKMPSFIWVRPETIARSSLAALKHDRAVCIPDARFRVLSVLLRLTPRSVVRRVASRLFGDFTTYRLDDHDSPRGEPRDSTAVPSPAAKRAPETRGQ